MSTTLVRSDALVRALRTFWQGFSVDLAVAAVAVLVPLLSDVRFTGAWAAALGAALLKTITTAIASYVARIKIPPRNV